MTGRNGQEHLSTYVPKEVADAFRAWARQTDGSASGALRRLVAEAVDRAKSPDSLPNAASAQSKIAPVGVGRGTQIGLRLQSAERMILGTVARSAGMTPANWVRSLALVHLAKRPQWTPAELEALRDLFRELRAIGNNVNQIAHAMNIAIHTGHYPQAQGDAAREAAEQVRVEMRRVVAVLTGNFDYWGLPDSDRPTAARGTLKNTEAQARKASDRSSDRPRRQPARFRKDD